MDREKEIAEILLQLKAVSVSPHQPFTWASGLRSPLYCDNRLIISTVSERRAVTRGFVALLEAHGWHPECIAGTATAGIPHAAWLADALDLPMVYVRGAEKKHGKKNRIEGALVPGTRVVLIEDLISTGGSVLEAAGCLRAAESEVLGVAAIFQYGLKKARDRFDEAGLAFDTLTGLDALIGVAIERGMLNGSDRAVVDEWRRDPQAWSASRG